MQKVQRAASLLVASAMAVTMFAGCGKSSDKASGSSAQNKGTADKAPVTIEWLAYQTTAQPDPESKVIKMVEEKYNVKFKFWYIDEKNWNDSLNVKLAAGTMPDVLRLRDASVIPSYVKQGILGELPVDRIKKSAPNYMKVVDKYDTGKIMWNYTKYDGKNYGFMGIALDGLYPPTMVWRTDWLKNVGINKIPETLQEFETAVYKFRNEDPDKNGKKDTYGLSHRAMEAVYGAFGIPMHEEKNHTYLIKDGKPVFARIQPEAKEALALLQKWYKDGVIDPEFITGENTGGYVHLSQAFINSRIGVTRGAYYHYNPPLGEGDKGGQNYVEIKKVNPNAAFEPGKPPVGPKGKSGTTQAGYAREPIGLTTQCTKDERKTEAVLKMLDDLYGDEKYAILVRYGIEGEDYAIKNGEIVGIGDDSNSRVKGLQIFNFLNVPPDLLKKYKKVKYDYADKVASFPGYVSPFIPPTDAGAKNNANLFKLADEAYVAIISGAKSVDSFDEFVKTFRKNGGDEVEKAMQEEYSKLTSK